MAAAPARAATTAFAAMALAVLTAGCATTTVARGDPPSSGSPQISGMLRDVADRLTVPLAPEQRRVAVLGLTGSRPEDAPLAAYLSDALVTALGGRGLELVERHSLRSALEEQALGQTGVIDPTTAAEVGRISGASVLVVGSVTSLATKVDLHVRVVDAGTAHILATAGASLPRGELTAHLPAKPARAAPLSLSTLFVAERRVGDTYEKILIRDDSRLQSGDGLKIAFETNRDAYVYILMLDSQGAASVVFPHAGIQASNRTVGGTKVEVPPGSDWFYLDEATGRETVYVLASLVPLEDTAALTASLQRAANPAEADQIVGRFAAVAGESTMVTRGLGGIRPGRAEAIRFSNGELVEQAVDLLEGTGAVVRAVTFIHE